MHRCFIRLSFDGRHYHGWQSQKNASSVQSVLEEALSLMLGNRTQLVGCGRTDTGVHARDFYAHFDCRELTAQERLNLVFHLNGYLPPDISVHSILPVKADAHARFDAVSRTYTYQIIRQKDPFLKDYAYYVFGPLDIDLMTQGAQILLDYSDFTSFSRLHTQVKTNLCRIQDACWEEKDHLLVFTIKADRFLRNMVRAIAGTLLEVGRNKITLEDLRTIIEAKDRQGAGCSVPACGLFLEKVEYPDEIFNI